MKKHYVVQSEYDCHDCGTPTGDGCETCLLWQEQEQELIEKEKEYLRNKKHFECLDCKGIGEVSTMERVYNDDIHLAPVGIETCQNCSGTGLEPNEDLVVERIVENLSPEQEDILQERHADGYMGCDDDMSDAFEHWLSGLDLSDFIRILKLK